MATFFTALVWGLGVSLGAVTPLIAMILALRWFAEGGERDKATERSVTALEARNELSGQQVAALRRIAETMEEANA